MQYAVVYNSKTGNTKMLAEAISGVLTHEDCIYVGSPIDISGIADRIYVGFWTDQGTCDEVTKEFLKHLKSKEVFLFGTCGFGGEQSYYDRIMQTALDELDSSVKVIGTFMCQGKMPRSVRERYERMKASSAPVPNIDAMIENFDQAEAHPDLKDIANLVKIIEETL